MSRAWYLSAALLLTGCASAPEAPPPTRVPGDVAAAASARPAVPEALYRDAAARGQAVYRLIPARSQVRIYSYRGGPLARFGHNHVIVGRGLDGFILLAEEITAARSDLVLRLDSLEVDPTAERRRAGPAFASEPTSGDMQGTRDNMLGPVLEAQRYPLLAIEVHGIAGAPPVIEVKAHIRLHGVTRTRHLPVLAHWEGKTLVLQGALLIRQSDFGITPYSALGGALRVNDGIGVSFRLAAAPWRAP